MIVGLQSVMDDAVNYLHLIKPQTMS